MEEEWNRQLTEEVKDRVIKAWREKLTQDYYNHAKSFEEISQFLELMPISCMKKVEWNTVLIAVDVVKKFATMVGRLWTGIDALAIQENMAGYFDMLEVLLLLSNGSMVGGGPTISTGIRTSVTHVIVLSSELMHVSVHTFGVFIGENENPLVPNLVDGVIAACSVIEKHPGTNITAIGRALTRAAFSVNYVLSIMKEFKLASSPRTDEASTTGESQQQPREDDDSSDDDLGIYLSPEEMNIAQLSIGVASETIAVIKETIHYITDLHNEGHGDTFVESFETFLTICQEIALQVNKIGQCLYPPQKLHALKKATKTISTFIDDIETLSASVRGLSPFLIQECSGLKIALSVLDAELKLKL